MGSQPRMLQSMRVPQPVYASPEPIFASACPRGAYYGALTGGIVPFSALPVCLRAMPWVPRRRTGALGLTNRLHKMIVRPGLIQKNGNSIHSPGRIRCSSMYGGLRHVWHPPGSTNAIFTRSHRKVNMNGHELTVHDRKRS